MKPTLILLAILLSLSFVLAIPEFPVQVYGDVTGLEGVELRIMGPSFNDFTTTILGSKIQDVILINSDQIAVGDQVDFKFVGYEKHTETYDGGEFIYIDIDVSDLTTTTGGCLNSADCDTGEICNNAGQCVDDPNYCTGNSDCPSGKVCRSNTCVDDNGDTGGGSRRGGSRRDSDSTSSSNAACITRWICSEFGDCIGGYKTRTCFKEFPCNDTSIKPIETAVCEIPVVIKEPVIIEEPEPIIREEYIPPPAPEPEPVVEESSGILMYIFILIAILLIVALAYVYYDHLRHRIHEYHIDPRMDKYVKDTLAKGFKVEDIKIALINAGWNEDQVNKYFYENPDLGEKVYVPPQKETPLRSAIRKNVQARPIKKEPSFIPEEDQESLDKLANIANPLKEAIKIKPELKSYIDSTLEEGFSKKEIEKALLKKGWKKEEYEEYLFHA